MVRRCVKLLSLDSNLVQIPCGRVCCDENGKVSYIEVPDTIAKDLDRGVKGQGGSLVMPSDGNKFIDALPFALSGSYLRAVKED